MGDWFIIWGPHLIGIAFVAAFGGCVGSFLNVVVYRLPLGMSVINPPSRCCSCGRRLRAHENLPVIGWFISGRRCWSCGCPISIEYPAIEAIVALLFAAAYAVEFIVAPHSWLGRGGALWFQTYGFVATAPVAAAIFVLIASLVAATLTDLRTFTIPLAITLTATLVGFAGWTIQGAMATPAMANAWPMPRANWGGVGLGLGGILGLAISLGLLGLGTIKRSFADYDTYVKAGETLGDYPHARREMRHEIVFLLPIVALAVAGFFLLRSTASPIPPILQGLSASALGYLAGAGIVWVVRIVATLAKGIEAMGMGDVHLLGAAGAVLGWVDPIAAFFIAPFFGLSWVGLSWLRGRMRGGPTGRELPYGPHLALAILALILLRPFFLDAGRLLFPGLISGGRSLHGAISSGQIPHLPDCPEVHRTSEKGLSNEADMDCWQRCAHDSHDARTWM